MVFIVLKNDNILTVCDSIESVYHNILTYVRIIIHCDKNKIDYIKNLKIIEYSNCCPINSYKIDENNLNIYDENKTKIDIKNLTLSRQKVELEVLLKKDIESEINLFIPLDPDSSDDYKIENDNIYIKQDINSLKEQIELEKIKLEKKNEIFESKLQKVLDINHELKLYEKEQKLQKEKEEEEKRIFNTNKNIFNCIINEINDGIRDPDDIPELLKNNFIVFQKLKEENDYVNMTESEEYNKYIEIKNSLNLQNTNIKTNYDGMFDSNAIYKKLYNELNETESNNSDNSDNSNNFENSITD